MDFDLLWQGSLIALLAWFIRGISGFGSALIAVPLLALTQPLAVVVPVVVALDYLSSLLQGGQNWRLVAWRKLLILLPFAVIGIGLGLSLLTSVPARAMQIALGLFVIGYAVYQLSPVLRHEWGDGSAVPAGLIGGIVGTWFGTSGPIYVIYLRLRGLDGVVFRATIAMNFIIDGGLRLLGFIGTGLYGPPAIELGLYLLPAALLGLCLGGRMHLRLSQTQFRYLISALLIGSGMALLIRAV